MYAPLDGEILAVNERLSGEPQTVNTAPFGDGWLFTMKPSDPAAAGALMTADAYDAGPGA